MEKPETDRRGANKGMTLPQHNKKGVVELIKPIVVRVLQEAENNEELRGLSLIHI